MADLVLEELLVLNHYELGKQNIFKKQKKKTQNQIK